MAYEPKMWESSIIGFGSYHYKYQSGHEVKACVYVNKVADINVDVLERVQIVPSYLKF